MATRAKPDASGNRVPLMVRTAPALRDKLEAAAKESGRSLAQEAELRLERSFELVALIERAIDVTADKAAQTARDQVALIEQHMLEMGGGDDLFRIGSLISYIIRNVEGETGKKIREDEFTRNKAEREVLGAVPGIFRRLPGTYSEFKAEVRKRAEEGTPSFGLAALYPGNHALPPLGWKGPWPPEQE